MENMNCYKINEVLENRYYQVPMELCENPKYRKTTNSDAKLLYGFLLDRLTLSKKNNWYDENGNIYLIFTRQEVADKMYLSEKTASKAFKQLSDVKLIYEKRRGLGKPNWIFVGKIEHEEIDIQNKNKLQVLNSKIYGSGKVENTVLDRENLLGIKPNNINTNISNLILSNQDEMDMKKSYGDIFKQNIEYDILICDKSKVDLINNITDIAIDTLNSSKEYVYINSEPKPTELVKSQLLKLNPGHIEYVINCLKSNAKEVKNIKSYILTCLYNSVNTMSLDTTLAVGYMMNN